MFGEMATTLPPLMAISVTVFNDWEGSITRPPFMSNSYLQAGAWPQSARGGAPALIFKNSRRFILEPSRLERQPQPELHDSRSRGCRNLSSGDGADVGRRVIQIDIIEDV